MEFVRLLEGCVTVGTDLGRLAEWGCTCRLQVPAASTASLEEGSFGVVIG